MEMVLFFILYIYGICAALKTRQPGYDILSNITAWLCIPA